LIFRLRELGRSSQQVLGFGDCCPLAFAAGFEFPAVAALHATQNATAVVEKARMAAVKLLSSPAEHQLDGVLWSTIRGQEGLPIDGKLASDEFEDWKTTGHYEHDDHKLSTGFQFGIAVGFGRPVVSFDMLGGVCRSVHIYGARDGDGHLKRTSGRIPGIPGELPTCLPTIPFHFSVTFEEALHIIRTTICSVVEYNGTHFTAWPVAPQSPSPALYIQPECFKICPPRPEGFSLQTDGNGECFFESIERVRAFNNESFFPRMQLRIMACDWLAVPIDPQHLNAPENTEQRARADLESALKDALWTTKDMQEALCAMQRVAPEISEQADTSSILNTYAVVAREHSFFADQILITATAWAIGATVCIYRNKSNAGQPVGPTGNSLPIYNVLHVNNNHFEGLVEWDADLDGGAFGGGGAGQLAPDYLVPGLWAATRANTVSAPCPSASTYVRRVGQPQFRIEIEECISLNNASPGLNEPYINKYQSITKMAAYQVTRTQNPHPDHPNLNPRPEPKHPLTLPEQIV